MKHKPSAPKNGSRPSAITLHIERLVLDGLPMDQAQGEKFMSALEEAIAAALSGVASVPVSSALTSEPARVGPNVRFSKRADAFANAVAASVHHAMLAPSSRDSRAEPAG